MSSFLNYSFRSSLWSIYSCLYYSIYEFFIILISKSSCKWLKAITFKIFLFSRISHFHNIYPIISVILTLSSISSCLQFWSVNHSSIDENSVFVVFSIVNEWGAIVIDWPNWLFDTKVNNILDACWYLLLTKLQCTNGTKADSNFGTSSPSLSRSTYFFLYFLTISLFQEIIILVYNLFWFLKQSCFLFYWCKFVKEDYLL